MMDKKEQGVMEMDKVSGGNWWDDFTDYISTSGDAFDW